jgi:hypothetical protein
MMWACAFGASQHDGQPRRGRYTKHGSSLFYVRKRVGGQAWDTIQAARRALSDHGGLDLLEGENAKRKIY